MEKTLETVKYSFVLPAYKAKYLKEAIDSILNQTYADFELIIVNDASPEDLDSIVNSYDDKRIQYYRNEQNMGGKDLVAQWNFSISYATGEYLILASDDDVYSSEYLAKMDSLICRYPEVNVFRPRIRLINEYGNIIGIEGYQGEYQTKIEYLYSWTQQWIGSGIPYFIFKREALMAIGGFVNYPLAWFSDDATVFKLIDNGIGVYSTETLFSFRHSTESISTAQNTPQSLAAKYRATRMFYDEHIAFIRDYVPKDSEEAYLLGIIKKRFPKLIKRGKVGSQLKVSSPKAILTTINEGRKIECVPIFYIASHCLYPIKKALKRKRR